jgi:glycosyltransferase involved in cell wall biosynthesis
MTCSRDDRRISLLLVSHSYPPALGGSEVEAQLVCSALLRRGHDVTVLCSGGPPMPAVSSWTDPHGVPVRIFGRSRFLDYAFALGVVWTLLRERRRYQLVYFLMQGLHLAAGLPVARFLGKPVVMKVSGSGVITMMRRFWMGRLELRLLRRWAHRVMILNSGMAGEAAAAGLEPDRLLWMPNPVDTELFAPCAPEIRCAARARLGLEPSAPVVIFVGRLIPVKNLPALIRAFATVRREVPNATLVLVGDGPLRSELETLAAGLGLDHATRFTGRQTSAEVREWLAASDVFALVSVSEGLPCSLLEAMSAGLPSIVSDIPASVQLVEAEIHGLHAPADAPDLIAGALTRLLLDAPLRARMGAAARQLMLTGYSIDKVVDRYEALFSEMLDAPAR